MNQRVYPDFVPQADYDGATYDAAQDKARLTRQLQQVFTLIQDGHWRTPEDFEAQLGARWASINARLRDLRKAKFGGFLIARRRIGPGLFQYALCRCPQTPCRHTKEI